jgi:anti-sigma B factor antagonist
MTTRLFPLYVEIQRESPETIIALVAGELDCETCPELQDTITEAVRTYRSASLIMDLGRLTFLDSEGIRTLIGFWQHAQQRNASMTISQASPRVLRVLTITGLLDTFGLRRR